MRARTGRSLPTGRELADVAVAQGALLAALLRARLTPKGRLVAPVAGEADGAPPPHRDGGARRDAVVERVARAVDRAGRRGLFRPTCLVRSLALASLLRRHGVEGARICIGVRRAGAGRPAAAEVDAHAWVELDGRVVGDDARHVAAFTPVGRVTSFGGR